MTFPRREPAFIVLDSNAFIADYWLRSPSFVLLRKFLQQSRTVLAVPRVVLEEVTNHYAEDLEAAESRLVQDLKGFGRLLQAWPPSLERAVNKAIKETESRETYSDFLRGQLEQIEARIVEYSSISHTDLLKRDLGRKRPFRDGKGYRDALIWESMLSSCLVKSASTIFVTQNTKDFCGDGTNLHDDLKRDLVLRGFEAHSIEIFPTLPSFTDAYIVPCLKENKEFAALVEAGKISGLDLRAVCEDNIDRLVEAINNNPRSMIGSPEIYEPGVEFVDIDGEVEVEETSEISDKILLVIFNVYPKVSFVYFLPREEFVMMSEESAAEIAILNPDWNEFVMEVEETRRVRIKCRLTFNAELAEVEAFEVEEVDSWNEY